MVRLKNIKINNHTISCDIYPEDSSVQGFLSVDTDKEEITNYKLPYGYEECISHVYHAKRELLKLFKEGNVPKERVLMWF